MGQTPALASIGERTLALERCAVVEEPILTATSARTACRRNGNAFAEVLRIQLLQLQDLAVFDPHLADGRTAVQARAFVEHPIEVFKTLREGLRIVGKDVDDTITGDWSARRRRSLSGDHSRHCCDDGRAQEKRADGSSHGYLNRSSNALRALAGGADFVSRSTVVRGSKNVHALRVSFGEIRAGIGADTRTPKPVSKLRHCAQAWRSAPQRAHWPSGGPRHRNRQLVAAPAAPDDLAETRHVDGFGSRRRLPARRVFLLFGRLVLLPRRSWLVPVSTLPALAVRHLWMR